MGAKTCQPERKEESSDDCSRRAWPRGNGAGVLKGTIFLQGFNYFLEQCAALLTYFDFTQLRCVALSMTRGGARKRAGLTGAIQLKAR